MTDKYWLFQPNGFHMLPLWFRKVLTQWTDDYPLPHQGERERARRVRQIWNHENRTAGTKLGPSNRGL